MRKVYLVHCWGGTVTDGWYPWLAEKLREQHVGVVLAEMPDSDAPRIDKWVAKLSELVEGLSEAVFFVGHSVGCQTILRYLETQLPTTLGGVLLVAPWFDLLPAALSDGSDEIAAEWLQTPLDFAKVCQFTTSITAIFSDDDPYVSLEQVGFVQDRLKAKTLVVSGQGHISAEDDVTEPEYLWQELADLLG
jgi:predicted alpha/beta hydrolase family esterase